MFSRYSHHTLPYLTIPYPTTLPYHTRPLYSNIAVPVRLTACPYVSEFAKRASLVAETICLVSDTRSPGFRNAEHGL